MPKFSKGGRSPGLLRAVLKYDLRGRPVETAPFARRRQAQARTWQGIPASKLRDPDTDYADDKAPDDAKWAQEAQRRQEVLAALQKRFPDAPARGWSASWTPGSSSGASRPSGSGAFCQNSS
jgi:outer membrane receptor for ferric coprogen and ferric-rhodotorulic acid